jgi:hypothetical protein
MFSDTSVVFGVSRSFVNFNSKRMLFRPNIMPRVSHKTHSYSTKSSPKGSTHFTQRKTVKVMQSDMLLS